MSIRRAPRPRGNFTVIDNHEVTHPCTHIEDSKHSVGLPVTCLKSILKSKARNVDDRTLKTCGLNYFGVAQNEITFSSNYKNTHLIRARG